MVNNNLLATTSWRNYLLPRNQRVTNFLKSRGSDVFWQICQNIHEAYRDKKSELMMLIHPNLSHAILIPCLLYTSDAADELDGVDLGGRRIIKKKKN